MKTLLLLLSFVLLHASFVSAGETLLYPDAKGTWVWKGQKWKGQVHKMQDGKIWVTGDVSNYRGVWLTVADLDAASRGWLGLGSAPDTKAFAAQSAREAAQAEQERRRRIAAAVAADEAAKARLAYLQQQRDAAAAAKAADLAEKQRAFDNYLRVLEVQALQALANRR